MPKAFAFQEIETDKKAVGQFPLQKDQLIGPFGFINQRREINIGLRVQSFYQIIILKDKYAADNLAGV